ncbi:MAG: recombinase family protein [Dehalococcoidales bacterium]|nr:recombinase family protein [Dehalococcoidales bacterium]
MDKIDAVAVYAVDVSDQKFKEFHSWVVAQGFTNIIEYRDTTTVRGRSGDKKLGQMMQDVKEDKICAVFIPSLLDAGLIGVNPMNLLLTIVYLNSYGARLISRDEPRTDMSTLDLIFVYLAYCEHQESELDVAKGTMFRRTRKK